MHPDTPAGETPATGEGAPSRPPTPPENDQAADTGVSEGGSATPAEGAPQEAPAVPKEADAVPEESSPTPRRRSLLPRWLPWAAGGLGAAILVAILIAVVVSRTGLVNVPNVEGLALDEATERLQHAGLTVREGDRRFSATVERGLVLDQSPPAGTRIRRGTVVVLDLSAGSETFKMPDILGWKLPRARSALQSRGLNVLVDYAPSKLASGTVIASVPSAGVTLSTGDTVRITIATSDTSGGLLLPTDLRGRSFVIDPAPMPVAGLSDAPMDVTRRLRALLEASGATVTVTRDVIDPPGITPEERSRRTQETSATAFIGFSVTERGTAGLSVLSVPAGPTTSQFFIGSASLSTAIQTELRGGFPDVRGAPGSDDVVLLHAGTSAARVVLGSAADPADVRSFSDPSWADMVAQNVYRALASLYGSK